MSVNFAVNLLLAILVGFCAWWGGYRLLRGTGKKFGILFAVILTGLVMIFPWSGKVMSIAGLLGIGILELRHRHNKKAYSYSQLTYEGGGIRRGLLPVEVGTLYSLTASNLFVLGLIELLQKGFVKVISNEGKGLRIALDENFRATRTILNPISRREARQEIAYQNRRLLTPAEDVLLEIFDQNSGKELGDYSIQPWIDVLSRTTDSKISGYDLVETQNYYKEYRSHRLTGIERGFFNSQEHIGWMILSRYLGDEDQRLAMDLLKKTRPSWLKEGENCIDWLNLWHSVSW